MRQWGLTNLNPENRFKLVTIYTTVRNQLVVPFLTRVCSFLFWTAPRCSSTELGPIDSWLGDVVRSCPQYKYLRIQYLPVGSQWTQFKYRKDAFILPKPMTYRSDKDSHVWSFQARGCSPCDHPTNQLTRGPQKRWPSPNSYCSSYCSLSLVCVLGHSRIFNIDAGSTAIVISSRFNGPRFKYYQWRGSPSNE